MSRKKVLVLGGNFAGLTAALAVRHELHGDVDVRVVAASEEFLFNPSLIWLPFGKRRPADITFPLAPTFESHGVDFVHAEATALDLDGRKVTTTGGVYDYDYLVIATGYRNNFDVVPGLGPGGNAYTITTLEDAIKAGEGWRRFLRAPGDIVVGATQGAGCFGAAYEYLFNLSHQLRKAGLKRQVKLTWVSSEPFLGHFGIGGLPHGEALLSMFLKKEHITPVMSTAMDHVDEGRLVLGIAVAVDVPWQTPTPVGIPKTGFPAERMAHVAARNIAAQIKGEPPASRKPFGDIPAVCVMDAGNNGVIILADKMLPPRKHGLLIPGPQAHAMKLGFEKYFLWKTRHGYVGLP